MSTTMPLEHPASKAPNPALSRASGASGALAGRIALVTGGGRGLGEALCRALGERGAHVVVADVREELAREVERALTRDGGSAEALALDVTDAPKVERALGVLAAAHGHIDIVINNAGVDRTVPVDELSLDDWERIIAVNLSAPFIMSRAALPYMKRHGGGHIVNIVSTAAKRAWANASAYHASKWGLLGFSHALHVEARPHKIKVTAVVSGGLRTPFLLDRFPDIDVGTLQDPANVANTVMFVLTQPEDCVIPEIMVLPMRETSWP